jgi:NAD(P)-dependent dehydrogenase (short-subunit alcohol dehydrogenase family)
VDGALSLELDVRSVASIDQAFADIERNLGPVELLVLNAGVFTIEPFEETSLESWRETLSVNLDGAFLCAQPALPAMRDRRFGRLVGIGSSAGKTGGAKSVAAYAASKAGLMTLVKSVAREYAAYGVRANAVAPALIDTEMIKDMHGLVDAIPIRRLGTVHDVADVVVFLLSKHADYITGEAVNVTGGFLID